MHFEYPSWTGDSATPSQASGESEHQPRPRARSNSFTYRNAAHGGYSQEEFVYPTAYPGSLPLRSEEYYDFARTNATLPIFHMPPYQPYMYSGVRMTPQEIQFERVRAYEHERERRQRAQEQWERAYWAHRSPGDWNEWYWRDMAFARHYDVYRARARHFPSPGTSSDDYEGSRGYTGWGYPRTSRAGGDEWSWWRRAQALPRGRGTFAYTHPFSHYYPAYSRHTHTRVPSDTPSSSTGTSTNTSTGASSTEDSLLQDAFASYEAAWAILCVSDATVPLTFDAIPWPQHPSPRSVDEIDADAVREFLSAGTRSLKAHTREALLRFHPDKSTILLAHIASNEEREQVAAACAAVTQCLGELLKG